MGRHIYHEWRDENACRFFPFDRTDPQTVGGQAVPAGLIVDAAVHPTNSRGALHLSSITVEVGRLLFGIADTTGRIVATGVWTTADVRSSIVELLDEYQRCAGVLVIHPEQALQVLNGWTRVQHTMVADTATFVLACCDTVIDTDVPDNVQGVPVEYGGELYLVAERGLRFKRTEDPAVVELHAIGDPLFLRDNCDAAFSVPRLVREVVFQKDGNNVIATPDEYGNVTFVVVNSSGNAGLSVQTRANIINVGYSA